MGLVKELRGVRYAVLILGLWFISLCLLLSDPVTQRSWLEIGIEVLGRTILHTGLFILGHDAMHHNLAPRHQWINHGIGRITTWLYAFLPYEQCQKNHRKHHAHPGQKGDPDFHDGTHADPIRWYIKFLGEYLSIEGRIVFLLSALLIGLVLSVGLKVSIINLILFVIVPLCLSSIQLFIFGTYLPHRQCLETTQLKQRLQRSFLYRIWSFMSCYHFGCYHFEHHHDPHKPWYELPETNSLKIHQ